MKLTLGEAAKNIVKSLFPALVIGSIRAYLQRIFVKNMILGFGILNEKTEKIVAFL
jgi:hypothetical protein